MYLFFERIIRWLDIHTSVFQQPSLFRRRVRATLEFFQSLAGGQKQLHARQSTDRPEFQIDGPARALLARLLRKGIIASWYQVPFRHDKPRIVCCTLWLDLLRSPSGKRFTLQSGFGGGVGHTLNEAIRPALAEALERHAMCVWDPRSFIHGSFHELQSRGAVDPNCFVVFSETQLSQPSFQNSRVTHDQEMQWVSARALLSGQKKLVPAQPIYLNYNFEYPHEPMFLETTSNGAAAGISVEAATYSALCELIERDSLMIYWLNKLTPQRIKLSSIPIPRVQELIEETKRHGLTLHILDITTDLDVPAFSAILVDNNGGRAVSMSAVSDLDQYRAIEKVVFEVLKFPLFSFEKNEQLLQKLFANQSVGTIDERRLLWSDKRMIPKINFFVSGEEISFSDLVVSPIKMDLNNKFKTLKRILHKNGYDPYIVDITTNEARNAGIHVVKALLPQLVPVYFNESMLPRGVERLHKAPIRMEVRSSVRSQDHLNTTPHPFL